ncbi:MAG TPA: hypothetical protein VEX41_10230 [Candidatus Eisenbacteria bacterium]|nr:hypothetical protein [Candidatus Eisenbacteria bacterium]
MAAATGARAGATTDLALIEARLRAILEPYRELLETFQIYGQEMLRRPGARSHDWFAGVRRGNDAVIFSLLPPHGDPSLLDGVSPALRNRKTGASVYTFKVIDDALLAELEALTARSFAAYQAGRPSSNARAG